MGKPAVGMRFQVRLLVATAVVAVALGGCASRTKTASTGATDPVTTGSIGPNGSPQARAALDAAARNYEASPRDSGAAITYAQALRANGQTEQAVAVLRRAVLDHPKDVVVASAYGKALASNGDFQEALKIVRAAIDPTKPDWRLMSAEAAILDQTGMPAEARRLYNEALKIAPDEPTILNNLGLSYVLTNELPQAEATLRRASTSPRADNRVRQNLALTLGLQGKFSEAESVATASLPPSEAAENMAYLKSMLAQQNTWAKIKATDKPKS